MTEARFKIMFSGELMPESDLESTQEQLARLFKSERSRIAALFSGQPVALKRDLNEAQAQKYQQALQRAGARVQIEAESAPAPVPEPISTLSLVPTDEPQHSDPQAATMDCPKCGHTQAQALDCQACGVIIEKYLARQAQAESQASHSPYASPSSEVGRFHEQVGELSLFSFSGRIGRVRYLGWSAALLMAIMGLYLVAAIALAISPVLGGVLMTAIIVASTVVSAQIGVQRLHDIGWSGWLWLLNLVPVVNVVIALIMLFAPGTPSANTYGPPPPANTLSVKLLAFSWIVFPFVIGILAALAIPQYQEYVKRSEAAQMQFQQE
jgi:uncharacterized membrane protein YhaH (DUF805 family)